MCSSRVVIAMVVAVVMVEAIASIIGSLIVVFTNESQQGSANTTETIVSKDDHRRPGLGPFKLTPNSSSLNFVFVTESVVKTQFCSIGRLTPNSSSLIFVRSWFTGEPINF